ncbi:MAG: hypothetical protein Q4F83_13115 [Eubacteriales bacterium]|nr:hypothetical protein [Eubacteriales bacterium]
MDSMFSIMDIIIILSGLYLLYTYYLMKFKGEVKESILLPKDLPLKKCKDISAYISEMSPKVLIYGAVVVLCGVVGLVEDVYHVLGWIYLAAILVFVVVSAWFIVQAKNAVKKYWP